MVCKICDIFVPTCFERIEKHLAGPKHVQNFRKQQLDNVVQKTCKFYCIFFHNAHDYLNVEYL
jgi:hypothetical protein